MQSPPTHHRTLGDEQLARVLRFFQPSPASSRDEYEDQHAFLKRARRVSKQWKRVVEPILWEYWRSRDEAWRWDGEVQQVVKTGAGGLGRHFRHIHTKDGDLDRLHSLLEVAPNLISLEVLDYLECEQMIKLCELPNLQRLVLDNLELDYFPTSLPSLTQLSLVSVNLSPSTLSSLVTPEVTPNLRALLLDEIQRPIEWDQPGSILGEFANFHGQRLEMLQFDSYMGVCEASPDVFLSGTPILVGYDGKAGVPRVRAARSPRLNAWGEFSDEEGYGRGGYGRGCYGDEYEDGESDFPPQDDGLIPPHLHLRCPAHPKPDFAFDALTHILTTTSPCPIKTLWLPPWTKIPLGNKAVDKLLKACKIKGVHVGYARGYGKRPRLVPEFWDWAKPEKGKKVAGVAGAGGA
ncbi:hypothetical protein JCM10213v2_003365 [Rhodosporidiobolus nylandii]